MTLSKTGNATKPRRAIPGERIDRETRPRGPAAQLDPLAENYHRLAWAVYRTALLEAGGKIFRRYLLSDETLAAIVEDAQDWLTSAEGALYAEALEVDFEAVRKWVKNGCPLDPGAYRLK